MNSTNDSVVHVFNNGKIIINIPGADGGVNGYKDKYTKIAKYIIKNKLGAVIQISNQISNGSGWDINLKKALSYALKHSKEVCGTDNPEIYLMAVSAGAGAASMTAWKYPEVTKILLIEPIVRFDWDQAIEGIKRYKNKVVILVGDESMALGKKVGNKFLNLFVNAKSKELIEIENCNHQFTGEINSRILSESPIYAFGSKKIKFPNPRGGIKLYD